MENEKTIRLNRSQALIKLVNANNTYVMSPRGNGKTFSIGDRLEHLNETMPRSQILLLSDSYKRLEEKIVPNICDYFINHAGMEEGEDFVIYKKPPAHFVRPLIPLHNYEHVVAFANGMCLCLVSGHTEGNANAYNAQAMIVDEAKFVKESHVKQAALVLRGSFNLFGHLPEYRSKWFFTDKYPAPGSTIKWLLNKKQLGAPQEVIDGIVRLQEEVYKLDALIDSDGPDANRYNAIAKRNRIVLQLNSVRKNLTFYCDGLPMENIDNLGEKYYRDQKRELSAYEYNIAILNQDPVVVENSFYPALNPEMHYHGIMNDIDVSKPLAIALDYNWRITPMVVAQRSKLPDRDHNTFNILAGVHTLADGGITKTCEAFDKAFRFMHCKIVYYVFDHTAIGKSAAGDEFYMIVVKKLRQLGWIVYEVYTGRASLHYVRYQVIKEAMMRTGEGSPTFNKLRCHYLLLSMQQAGAITANDETKKDKSKEKDLSFPAEETTDYSEAFDTLYYAELQGMIPWGDIASQGTGIDL